MGVIKLTAHKRRDQDINQIDTETNYISHHISIMGKYLKSSFTEKLNRHKPGVCSITLSEQSRFI